MPEEKRIERRDPKGFLDSFLARVISRKLLVWGTSTVALFLGILPPSEWATLSLAYIGSQGLIDLAVAYKNAGA